MRLFVQRIKAEAATMLNPELPDAGSLPIRGGIESILIRQGESLVFRLRLDRYRQTALMAPIPSDRTDTMRYIVPSASLLNRTQHGFRVTRVAGRGVPATRRKGVEEAVRMSDGSFIRLDLPPITFSELGPVVLRFTARLPFPEDLGRSTYYGDVSRSSLPTRGLGRIRAYWLDFTERYEVVSAAEWQRRRQSLHAERVRRYDCTNDDRRGRAAGARTSDRETIAAYARLGLSLLGNRRGAETTDAIDRFLAFDRLHQSLTGLDQIRRQMRLARGQARIAAVMTATDVAETLDITVQEVLEPTEDVTTGEAREAAAAPAEFLLGLTPVVGDVIGIVEAVTGETLLTRQRLSAGERVFSGGLSIVGLLTVFGGAIVRLTHAMGEAVITTGRLVTMFGRRGARMFQTAAESLGGSEGFRQFSRLLQRVARGAALSNAERNSVLSYLRRLEDFLIAGHTRATRNTADRVGQAAFDEASRHIPAEEIGQAYRRISDNSGLRISGLDGLEYQVVERNGRRFLAVCR